MSRDEINAIGVMIQTLREHGDDYVIVNVGARGPNMDCPEGNMFATVRMGSDEACAEALYLDDALRLARGKIKRERELKEAEKAKAKAA